LENKADLLLLHGALGSSNQFDDFKILLSDRYNVHTLNFSGHGGLPLPDSSFSVKLFESDILNYLDKNNIAAVHHFGYSMGGYISLSVAANYPERVHSVFTLASKFKWNPETAAHETKFLKPELMMQKLPDYVSQLTNRHHPTDWNHVVKATSEFMIDLGNNPLDQDCFQRILCPVKLSVGDKDKMVSMEETSEVFKLIKNGSLLVLPDTYHTFELVKTERLVYEITEFCK